ncbi:MAG TPA: vWA domain-containing protein, partial [Thermoanaerobaculia bacterium]|nr:vWA domain-containing protein [Thermoanaerobaculia bacterium]
MIVDQRDVDLPGSGERIELVRAASSDDPNGPQFTVAFDAAGGEIEATRLEAIGRVAFESGATAPVVAAPAAVTINPTTNAFTLEDGETVSESIIVTIPANSGVRKADVYFLADNTGSMGSFINAVKSGASTILSSLPAGIDFAVGVGSYTDFPGSANPFQNHLSPAAVPANNAAIVSAINAWTASGGGDSPEASFFALDRLSVPPATAPIQWRSGAKRIIVQFGDVPSHDPICTNFTGDAANITEASVTAKLVAEKIAVLAISTATPGLNGNPNSSSSDYGACTPAGAAGQATRIAAATGGAFTTTLNPANIVATIINLITAAVSTISNVNVVATGAIVPAVVSITPPGGYGPLSLDKEHQLRFDILFKAPCKERVKQILNGTLDVVADGSVVAKKPVSITIPPCKPKELFSYSVKFVCGTASKCDCECGPVRPGVYATEINIHNHNA